VSLVSGIILKSLKSNDLIEITVRGARQILSKEQKGSTPPYQQRPQESFRQNDHRIQKNRSLK
jgi:hypothetical protein